MPGRLDQLKHDFARNNVWFPTKTKSHPPFGQ